MAADRNRTAIVIVHGMGEQLPVATLAQFAKSALPKVDGQRWYFSRADSISSSYEARCYRAYRRPFHVTPDDPMVHGNLDLYEYHWSYLMTNNRFSDVIRPALKLLLRPPWRVPAGLRVLWGLIWAALICLVTVIFVQRDAITGWSAPAMGQALGVTAVVSALAIWVARLVLRGAGAIVARTFVDVVRYLDRSPRSYSVRRDIRAGLVDLLAELHDAQRYNRVIVVGHSLGTFIAYDALTSLWPTMSSIQSCRSHTSKHRIPGLADLTRQAKTLGTREADREAFRAAQFQLWKDLRLRGNPWLVTDFITIGSPMYFADVLLTPTPAEFARLTRISELPICPPRPGTQTVEGQEVPIRDRDTYSHVEDFIEVLNHDAVFAVVRWTNMYFKPAWGFFGDWFGGPLGRLYGRGIVDQPLTGNRPRRLLPGLAHSMYFREPERLGPHDAASQLQRWLDLRLEATDPDWERLLAAPDPAAL